MSNLSISIDATENIYFKPGYKEWQSFDGQIYSRCSDCKKTFWCSPYLLKMFREGNGLQKHCTACKSNKFELIKFIHILHGTCGTCGNPLSYESRSPEPCNVCQSTSLNIYSVDYVNERPATFGTAFSDRKLDWCINVGEDLQTLNQEFGENNTRDYYSVWLHCELFIHFLNAYGAYENDLDRKNELTNFLALKYRQLFRETGDIDIANKSLKLIEKALKLVSDDLSVALYSHNAAMIIYSMLAKGIETVMDTLLSRSLRKEAIDYGKKAVELYERTTQLDEKRRNIKCGEVEWLIGDIVGAAIHTKSEADIAALRSAIKWYDLALQRSYLPQETILYIKETRNDKLEKLGWDEDPLTNNEQDELLYSTDLVGTIRNIEELALDKLADDDAEKAFDLFFTGFDLILGNLAISSKDTIIRNYGSQLTNYIVSMVKSLLDYTKDHALVLSLLEEFRAFTVWDSELNSEIQQKIGEIAVSFGIHNLIGTGPFRYLNDKKITAAINDLKQNLNNPAIAADECILFIELIRGEFIVFAIISSPDSQSEKGGSNEFYAESVKLNGSEMNLLMDIIKDLYLDNHPGKLRALRVGKFSDTLYKKLGNLISPLDNASFNRISIITGLESFPFETLFKNFSAKPDLEINFSPSLRIARTIKRRLHNYSLEKILIIGYSGSDLPYVREEIKMLRSVLSGLEVKVLDGNLNSAAILREIKDNNYDLIHFASHGEYDHLDPLSSKLILAENSSITAADFLSLENFQNPPLIVLSACSSAVTSMNGSNNILGLMGSFIRLGVTGIVGSRWPVGDEFAFKFMETFYQQLRQSNNPGLAVSKTNRSFHDNRPMDDWTSFIYIGG